MQFDDIQILAAQPSNLPCLERKLIENVTTLFLN